MPATIRPSFLTAMLFLFAATAAHAKTTPTQACAAAKNKAAGKYAACLQTAAGNFAANGDTPKFTTARGKCRGAFLKAWSKADAKAAKAGVACGDAPLTVDAFDESVDAQSIVLGQALAGQGLRRCGDNVRAGSEQCDGPDLGGETCVTQGLALGALRCGSGCLLDTSGCFATRYTDNGDGTVTDHQTGLQWEQKTDSDDTQDFTDPHDADNTYQVSAAGGGTLPDGSAFTDFLVRLNGASDDGSATLSGCFAGHCDWRLPTIADLQSIVDGGLGQCGGGSGPCIDPAFGPTKANGYWSSTSYQYGAFALFAYMDSPTFSSSYRTSPFFVRAVRAPAL
jgi:hypothetical protein